MGADRKEDTDIRTGWLPGKQYSNNKDTDSTTLTTDLQIPCLSRHIGQEQVQVKSSKAACSSPEAKFCKNYTWHNQSNEVQEGDLMFIFLFRNARIACLQQNSQEPGQWHGPWKKDGEGSRRKSRFKREETEEKNKMCRNFLLHTTSAIPPVRHASLEENSSSQQSLI